MEALTGKLFPYEPMHQWLSYGGSDKAGDAFSKREFSFTLANDIYIRSAKPVFCASPLLLLACSHLRGQRVHALTPRSRSNAVRIPELTTNAYLCDFVRLLALRSYHGQIPELLLS